MQLAVKTKTAAIRPKTRDEMTDEEFYAMIEHSIESVRQGKTKPYKEVFARLRRRIAENVGIQSGNF